MTTFRAAIAALKGKDVFVLLGGAVTKVTVAKITGDLVQLTLTAPLGGATALTVHVDSVQLVTA